MGARGFGLTMALGIACSSGALLGAVSLPAVHFQGPAPVTSAEVAGLSALSNSAPTVVTEASPTRTQTGGDGGPEAVTRVAPGLIAGDEEKASALVALLNEGRAMVGVGGLARDAALDAVALARAEDLVRKGYFEHYGPDGQSAFSELAERGIWYGIAGENLARNNYGDARTVEAAYEALMASEGHRANIVEARFARVGVAVVRSGRMWVYVMVFAD